MSAHSRGDSSGPGEGKPVIPASFAATMREVHGSAGGEWLKRLPALLDDACQRWQLEMGNLFQPLTYNYVIGVTAKDGTPAVLKAGFSSRELGTELAALRFYQGGGMVKLLASEETDGVLLLERLEPGETLETVVDDVAATSIAASVMRQLRFPEPPAHAFPTTADWGRGFARLRAAFNGGSGPFPAALVAAAEEQFAALEDTAGPTVLLHGDLHHGNILSATRAPWLAIDPKGVMGEPAYEVGAWLRNPPSLSKSVANPAAVTARRVSQLSEELSLDRQRVKGWGFAQAVLSAWWTYEDHGRTSSHALACAEWIFRA